MAFSQEALVFLVPGLELKLLNFSAAVLEEVPISANQQALLLSRWVHLDAQESVYIESLPTHGKPPFPQPQPWMNMLRGLSGAGKPLWAP